MISEKMTEKLEQKIWGLEAHYFTSNWVKVTAFVYIFKVLKA